MSDGPISRVAIDCGSKAAGQVQQWRDGVRPLRKKLAEATAAEDDAAIRAALEEIGRLDERTVCLP